MATAGQVGFGGAFNVAASPVGEVQSISISGIEVSDIEFKSMGSADGYVEYKPGMKEGGDVEVSFIFVDSDYVTLEALIGVADTSFDVTWADGAKFAWTGYLKSLSHEGETDGAIEMSCTCKVSGKPTFTAGA